MIIIITIYCYYRRRRFREKTISHLKLLSRRGSAKITPSTQERVLIFRAYFRERVRHVRRY